VSTLKKLEDDFEPLDREVRAASEQLQADLNAGIRAGKFDEAKLKADAAAIDKASLTAQAQEVDAIDGLYGALDPDQRSALITALRKREAAFQAGRPPAVPDAGASAAAAKRNQQTLDRMTKDLALDAKQKKEVAALLAKQEGASGSGSADGRDDMLKRLDAFLDAFDRPGFSAKDVDLTDSRPAHTPQSAEIGLLETLVPILTPEQREKLAAARSRPPPIHMRAPLN
jgi:Spy/CpxP family protein refolding chaperone